MAFRRSVMLWLGMDSELGRVGDGMQQVRTVPGLDGGYLSTKRAVQHRFRQLIGSMPFHRPCGVV